MKFKFALTGAMLAGLTGSAWAIGANESFYIFHDMGAKKCTIVKEKPTTGTVGTGEIFPSEASAKSAMDTLPECFASK